METQKLFRTNYIERLVEKLQCNRGDDYLADNFDYSKQEEIPNMEIKAKYTPLLLPKSGNNYDFENSKIIFESFPNLSPVLATDPRLWTYLTHVTYWEYMKVRRPVEKQPLNKRGSYILEHWFVRQPSAQDLLRNDISLLWWVAYLTHDETRKNPYELTEEAFSMLDYTRHLLPGIQGRNRDFTHAILEYVVENKDLFKNSKQAKVRFLMRKATYLAGYKVFPGLSKQAIKEIFDDYRSEIASVKDENVD